MTTRLAVWPPLPPALYAHQRGAPPFPLGEPGAVLFARARHGIHLGVRALGLEPGDEVLVPSYHHGSEVEALRRAGIQVTFYEATDTLAPDEGEVEALIGPQTRALYLIHYLGFPQDVVRWRRWCDSHGLLLMEDAAQAWLADVDGTLVGSLGDLAVFCLYKTYGLPDGAVLLVRRGAVTGERLPSAGLFPLGRRHLAWFAGRSASVATMFRWLEHLRADEDGYRPEEDFDPGTPQQPAATTRFLVRRCPGDAAARRRAHYAELLDQLGEHVPRPFDELPSGAAPFAFPLTSTNKAELLGRLDRAGVHGLDFWSVAHPSLPIERFPGAASRRASTVLLPVHQELRVADIARIGAAAGGRRPPMPQIEWLDDVDAARDDWRRLAEASRNVFATWEWASLWWQRYGRDGRLRLAALLGPGGERRALLPLVVWRDRPVRIARFLGYGTADQLGPVCARGDLPAATRALRRALDDASCDILLAEHVPAGDGWAALLDGGAVLRRERYPILRADDGWDAYLATRTAHFRKKIASLERRLGRAGTVRLRLADDAAGLDRDLDHLFSLHRARWPAGSEFLTHESFHREFARRALTEGWLRLWFCELDGVPAACWYGFRFAGVESHFQSGRNPRFERESPGTVLLVRTIRAALEDGVGEYRFLRGGEAYKDRFATEDPGVETVGHGRTAIGRLTIAGGKALDAVGLGRWVR
jgi:CelD/BcsL family acetyltransferase involved in cellulose biosynthesis